MVNEKACKMAETGHRGDPASLGRGIETHRSRNWMVLLQRTSTMAPPGIKPKIGFKKLPVWIKLSIPLDKKMGFAEHAIKCNQTDLPKRSVHTIGRIKGLINLEKQTGSHWKFLKPFMTQHTFNARNEG